MAAGAELYQIAGIDAQLAGVDEMDLEDYIVGMLEEDVYLGDGHEADEYVGGDIEDLLDIGAPISRGLMGRLRTRAGRARAPTRTTRVPSRRAVSAPIRTTARRIARAVAQNQVARIASNRPVITESMPQADYEWPLGFDSEVDIPALGSAIITANPQTLFRAKRLSVPGSIASDFTIDDIKVGNRSMLPAVGSIPAETFSNLSVGVRLKLTTAQVTMQISLSVTNISGAPTRFRATMIGDAVQ